MKIPVTTLKILIMIIPAHELMTMPAKELMTMPAKELMTMPAKVVMMMIYNKSKLVTCNYLKMNENTMSNMMKTHYENWFTDQCICHIMKMARNYCCRKQQICHEKTI